MSELSDLFRLRRMDDRMVSHRELHRIASLAEEEIERLQRELDIRQNEVVCLRNSQTLELHNAKDEIERLRAELGELVKAGTPYSLERDAINGLVIANQQQQSEIDRLRKQLVLYESRLRQIDSIITSVEDPMEIVLKLGNLGPITSEALEVSDE